MLVNSKELLEYARQKGFAVPSTNFIDSVTARAYTETAEKRDLPLILSYAQSHSEILSLEEAYNIGKFYAEKVSVPVVLHLDHGMDIDFIKMAIDLGFTSIMIDGSMLPFDENINITKEVVKLAHEKNITVEAELGHVGSNDFSESKVLTDTVYTEVNNVIEFVEKTNVDSLAISIGTAHGIYKGTPKINFDRLQEIFTKINIPLVLHGGSSSGDENLARCAKEGISKINIYSDFIVEAFKKVKNETTCQNYVDLLQVSQASMKDVLNRYYDVFGTEKF